MRQWLDVREIHAEDGVVVIPNRELLLTSMFSRAGVDLVISTPTGIKYIVKGFFLNDHLPTVSDGDSTHIAGELAAQFAGSIAPDQYAAAAPGAPGPVAGVVRSLTGVVRVIRASDGSEVQLKIGDPLYQDDIVETDGGAQVGLVFVDGTTLALGENGELVLDELVYDPSKAVGKGTLRLVSGAAEFVSGGIAKSGADNMVFQTPVATIGIRGTRVLAIYNPQTGDVTVVNRPTGADAAGNETAGRITLILPNGTVIGDAVQGNNGWQWNADPVTGLPNTQPTAVAFTPQQIQNIAAVVLDTVNNLQTQIQQQPNLVPTPQGGGTNAPTGGAAGPGGDANAGGPAAPADGAAPGAPPADGGAPGATPPTTPPPQTTQTPVINTGNVAGNLAATGNPNAGTTGTQGGTGTQGTAGSTTNAGAGTTTNTTTSTNTGTSTTTTPVTNPVVTPPPPPPNPVLFSIDGGTTSDATQSTITFTITRSGNLGVSASVNYATASGSAGSGTDFTGNAGTVSFAAGETSKTVTITVLANANGEPEESFSVSLNGASAGSGAPANIITASASGTITADPPLPSLSIAGVTVSDAVAGTAVLTITRTGFLNVPTTVTYQTAPGSASEGSDFASATGSISFAAGQATAQVSVSITADSATVGGEGAETFTVTLINPVGGLIDPNAGTATVVIAEDPLAVFSISAGDPVLEGGTAVLTVTRGGDLSRTVAVNYVAESGTATVGADTGGAGSGLLVFGIGVATQTISIPITLDTTQEQAESFTVSLRNPVGGTISQGSATVSILADPLATYAINSVQVAEGGTAVLTVTRAGDLRQSGSVSFTTVGGSATSPGDFQSANGTLNFAAGQATATISIATMRDFIQEQAESFTVELSDPVRGTIANGTGTVSISADPPLPTVSISGGSASDAAAGSLTFTITLSAPATNTITVDYTTESGSATAGSDFSTTAGTVTFNVGQTTQSVSVPIAADSTGEGDESFTMRLTGALGAVIAGGTATGTILADVVVPDIILSGGTTVSDATATSVVFTVTLSQATTASVTVQYATVAGTADSNDFGPQSGTLTFSPGITSQAITVPIHAFGTSESAETFSLVLSNASGGVLTTSSAQVIISADPVATSATIATLLATQGTYNNQNVIVTDSANIADIKTVDTANGTGTVTATTISDANLTIMRASGYVGTATNIAFTDVVGVEILQDFDIKTSGTVSASVVAGIAPVLLGSGAAYITNRNVEVIATPTLTNAQLGNVDAANGTGNVTVVGSGALLQSLVTSSVITSGYNVRVIGPISIADLSVIQAVVPGVTFGAIEDTAANIMAFVNGSGNIAGHPAIVVASGGPFSTNLTNIDSANGANPPGTVTIRGTLANLLAADNFGSRQVTITSGISGFSNGNVTTLSGMGASLVAVEDTAQNIIAAGISGTYAVQLLGAPSISEIGQVDALAGAVLYGSVADTVANLVAGTARLTAFSNIVPIITATPTVAQVEQILGIVNGQVGLMMSATNLIAAVPTFAGKLLPIIPMVTGSATIQQLLDIEPISPIATSYKEIADTYANISANLNYVTDDVNLTITDPITTGQYNLLDAMTTGTINYTPAAANDSPVFLGATAGNAYLQFDGTDDVLISNGSLTALQSHTIEVWFRTSDSGSNQTLSDVAGKADLYLTATGQLRLDLHHNGETKFVVGGPNLNDGQWHHAAYSFNHTTGAIELYIDGASVTESDAGGTLGLGANFATPFTATSAVAFGAPGYFQGDMGDVRVWDAGRTPIQVQSYFNGEIDPGAPNLKIWYTFDDYNDDDGSVSNLATAGGSGMDGTGSGASGNLPRPLQVNSDISQALNFNGTSTYVDTSIGNLSASFTLTAAFRMDVIPTGVFTIFGKGGAGGGNYDLQVYVNSGGGLDFAMFNGSTFKIVSSTETLQAGIWYSVAVTYDAGSGGMELFLNGETTGTPQTLGGTRQHDLADHLTIGSMNGGEYFDGDISRVTVWEAVLNSNDIDDLTDTSLPNVNQNGLVAAYPFADGVGSTWVTDSVSGGHNIYSAQILGGGGTWVAPAPPIARDAGYTFNIVEDTPFTFRIVASDPENNPMTFGTNTVTGGTLSGPRVINATTREYTFTPTQDSTATGHATITINDGTNPTVSQVLNFNISAVNDRPIILGLNDLPDVGDDDTDPPGQLISSMFTGPNFVDPDDSDDTIDGLVIVGNTANPTTHGAWQWSVNGTTWFNVGTVANDDSALVLSANSFLRFLPSPTGTLGNMPSLTVRALDQTFNGTYSTGGGAVTIGDQAGGKEILMGPPSSIGVEVYDIVAPPTVLPLTPGRYVQFDGVDDRFESQDPSGLTSHTMEAWIRVDPTNTNEMLIVGVGQTGTYARMSVDTGVLIVRIEGGGNIKTSVSTGGDVITDSDWHHVAYSYNAATQSLTLYIDGEAIVANATSNQSISSFSVNADIFIGGYASGPNNYFTGAMDNVRIWDAVRTAAEIAGNRLYSYPQDDSNLAGIYTLGAIDGNQVYNDGPGNAEDLTAFGDIKVIDFTPYALHFDAIDDVANVTTLTDLPGSLTIEARIRLEDATGERIVVSKNASGGPNMEFVLRVNNSNQLELRMGTGSTQASYIANAVTLSAKTWYDVAAVYNNDSSTNNIMLFIDGVQVTVSGDADPDFTAASRQVTSESVHIGEAFDGDIANLRIWEIPLSSGAIAGNISSPPASYDPGLVAYFDFLQGGDVTIGGQTVLVDASGAGHHGVISGANNAPTWVDDQLGLTTGPTPTFDAYTDEDAPISFTLAAFDADGNPITYLVQNNPSHGAVSVDQTGRVLYRPDDNYSGSDTFTIRATVGAASTDQDVTVTIDPIDDLPSFSQNAVFSVDQGTDPSTAQYLYMTIGSYLVDDESFGGVAIVSNLVNPSTQGKYQFRDDTRSEWVDIPTTLDNEGNGWVFSDDAQIRFVPVNGTVSGSVGGLMVRAIDYGYGGNFTNKVDSHVGGFEVTVTEARGNGLRLGNTAMISASVIAPVEWDGGASGSWTVATNWSTNTLPSTSDRVAISNASVTYSPATTQTVNRVTLTSSTLTIATQFGQIQTAAGVQVDATSTLVIDGAISVATNLENNGLVKLNFADQDASLHSSLYLTNNNLVEMYNDATSNVYVTSNTGEIRYFAGNISALGIMDNLLGGTLKFQASDSGDVHVTFSQYFQWFNHGTMRLTAAGTGNDDDVTVTFADVDEVQSDGDIYFEQGTGGGRRFEYTDFRNQSGGTIYIQTDTTFAGSMFMGDSGSNILIDSGKTLAIEYGTLQVDTSSFGGPPVFPLGGTSGGTLLIKAGATLSTEETPADGGHPYDIEVGRSGGFLTLVMGEQGGNTAYWTGFGGSGFTYTAEVTGVVNMYSAVVDVTMIPMNYLGSGEINVIDATGSSAFSPDSVTWRRGVDSKTGGEINVVAATSNSTLTIEVSQTPNNSLTNTNRGTINLTPTAGDAVLALKSTDFNNYGEMVLGTGTGAARVELDGGLFFRNRSGGVFEVNNAAAAFAGAFVNGTNDASAFATLRINDAANDAADAVLTITGTFVNDVEGVIELTSVSGGEDARLVITGAATLGGVLNIDGDAYHTATSGHIFNDAITW
ncbi:MAG: LamG-like jellyroll fold domain-containing protein, partial [Rhodospirillaceae bacterium]